MLASPLGFEISDSVKKLPSLHHYSRMNSMEKRQKTIIVIIEQKSRLAILQHITELTKQLYLFLKKFSIIIPLLRLQSPFIYIYWNNRHADKANKRVRSTSRFTFQ